MTKKQTSKDSIDSLLKQSDQKMKISLFSKPSMIKVYSFLLGVSFLASIPFRADASIFSDISDLFLGVQVKAEESEILSEDSTSNENSQNMDLTINNLEPSIHPDIKNADANSDMLIIHNDSFIYSDGVILPDVKFEKSTISDQIMVYTVEKGDTISGIADAFDVSPNTIRWENNITGNTVSVGKKLNILPVTGVKHIVKSGDTISKIADKYDAESEDVFIFNGIKKGDALRVGDIVFVPNGIIKAVIQNTNTSSSKVVYSNTKTPSGYYAIPVTGRVTSPYGPRKGGFHYGVDFGAPRGTPVYAAASGTVVKIIGICVEGKSSCGGRYGNYIVIEHSNGTKTFYAHLSKINVSVGKSVKQGQKIGAVGNTGRSTGPHLHFEIENANGSKMKPRF
jgi:LysM repeat protein